MPPRLLLFLLRVGFPITCSSVLRIASFESRNLGHNFIGTEHVLCALVRLPDSRLRELFAQRGIGIDAVRSGVTDVDGLGPHHYVPKALTPRLKKILAIAESEAARAKHLSVPQSLLLGIVIEGGGVATRVLKSLGFDLTRLRERLLALPTISDSPDGGPDTG